MMAGLKVTGMHSIQVQFNVRIINIKQSNLSSVYSFYILLTNAFKSQLSIVSCRSSNRAYFKILPFGYGKCRCFVFRNILWNEVAQYPYRIRIFKDLLVCQYNLIMNRYQLSDRNTNRFASPLIVDNSQSLVVPNQDRTCTDIICTILMVLCIGAFIGLLIYGIVTGNFFAIVSMHNSDQVRCSTQPTFKYGYLPDYQILRNAVCVAQCPSAAGVSMPCLTDSGACLNGQFTPSYSSFALDSYCVPDTVSDINIESVFNPSAYESWVYDLQTGWVVVILAAVAAVILSLLFFIFVRICTGPIIWLAITITILGMITIGVLFILQAKGVTVSTFIADRLSSFAYDTLIIIGSVLIAAALILLLLVICLRSRLSMGAKAVELGSIFLFENCCLTFLPISQIVLVVLTLVAMVFGGGYLYSNGMFSFPNNDTFPSVSLDTGQVIMVVVFLVAGVWLIFFFHGSNHFMLCSSVANWYFNQAQPCSMSLWRLVRYHSGSVALTSLVNGVFFIFKILAHILSFDVKEDDSMFVACFLRCLNAIFCIFRCLLRFLSDGTYVQIAITGRGYCHSTFRAFDLLADNVVKASITDGLSIFFTIFGILGVTAAVSVAAYFSVLRIPYYEQRISSPFVVTFVSGVISFVIACIYLSMIDISASSVLQCYLYDRESGRGNTRYANEQVKIVLMAE